MTDYKFIQQTLQLAQDGLGQVSPNPLVGALVVKDGEVKGRGRYIYSKKEHAEYWAIEEAGELARGATLYTNLEPCSNIWDGKRTGSCAQRIIESGITHVVSSMVDPNPNVNGRGFEVLRSAGIKVTVGWLEPDARRLNEKFIKYVTTSRPFVHLKMASSLDGRIATQTGVSKWITGETARAASRLLRHEYDAILVGIGTALADDPALTDRTKLPRHRPLVRVVLDTSMRTPLNSRLVLTAREFPLWVFTSQAEPAKSAALRECGVNVIECDADANGRVALPGMLSQLSAHQLTSLLVEGGAEVAASFVEQKLLDKITLFVAPKLIGGRAAYPVLGGQGIADIGDAMRLRDLQVTSHGDDLELTGYPQ